MGGDACTQSSCRRGSDDCVHKALAADSSHRVLIHCAAGVSRSVTITCAYLMRHHGLGARTALRRVQTTRRLANPNTGFRRQLLQYEVVLEERRRGGGGAAAGAGATASCAVA